MRVAFVVQRYGQDVAGGAEVLCRQTAQAFASRGHAVTVLTTTARDYLHWAPHYPAGPLRDGPVSVHRFAADAADPLLASRLGRRIALGWGDWDDQVAWAIAQGPVSRGLLATLKRTAEQYDVVVLWTYLYATTHLAMPLVAGRAILVPMAHDEPMLRFDVTRGVMALASGFAFLTPEERRLVDEQHDIASRPQQVVGAGLAPAVPGDATRARTTLDLPSRFALYLGRVDPGKGIDALFRAHAAYRAAGGELGLVLAGRVLDGVPVPEWVRVLGFVDAQTKADLLAESDVLVLPSTNESLSLVLMEAWQVGCPTLATAHSDVLSGQSARSGGGLVYRDDADYARQLQRLDDDADLRRTLSTAGTAWATRATWSNALDRWEMLIDQILLPRGSI